MTGSAIPMGLDTARAASSPLALPQLAVVVPCYNEADSIAKLAAALARLDEALADQYETEFVLVDDGSSDNTWQLLRETFAGNANVRLVRHAKNQGIAAAVGTGIRAASAQIVASFDADCTYDPLQIVTLLARLTDGVDMVVASPYH